ncbi:MAG: XRE family transcriptional regulator [Methylovulum sp.]|nr:XRE family transcriptional regulator [Methylovulum sp.]
MTSLDFNPKRLKLARARRSLTIKLLAEAIGMTSRIVSAYENGSSEPPASTLKNIALTLNYPEAFFMDEYIEEIDYECVSFRSMKAMTALQRNAALAAAQIAMLFNDWLEANFELPISDLCNFRESEIENPETAARVLREKWGLGELPIKNMIHLLEAKGVKVFSLAEKNKEVDAFSFWKNGTAFIFLNTQKSAERSRFDAAHELGHLLLHKHGTQISEDSQQKEDKRAVEREADKFASAFLMPEASVRANAHIFATIEGLIQLKKVWRVSIASLVRRLFDLKLITEWQYRTLNIEMSKRGMLKREPEGIDKEKSQIIDKAFKTLWKEGITRKDIARQLHLPIEEIDQLAFIGLSVRSTESSEFDINKRPETELRLVGS